MALHNGSAKALPVVQSNASGAVGDSSPRSIVVTQMNDIFLSYDRSDRAIAQKFADVLEAQGWTVWWDREIPLGKDFGETIEKMLDSARCVIVLWSNSSVLSRWVKTEAAAAADKNRLAPVFIEQSVVLPLEFRRIQAAELWGWSGDSADPEFRRLLEAVEQIVGSPAPKPGSIPSVPEPKPRSSDVRRAFPLKSIGLVAAIGLGLALLFVFLKPDSDPTKNESQDTPPPVSAGAAPGGGGQVAIPADAISVNIGDRIEEGKLPGAGKIEKPFEKDLYVFQAKPGQSVYFRVLKYSDGMAYIKWRLIDEDDTKVFDTCLGCTEPGVQVLSRGGKYLLTVGSESDRTTGTYRLQLFDVPPPQQFTVKIGDAIRENLPAPGAGAIESPGASDVYRFKAAAGQRVYFRMTSHSEGMSYMKWRLVDDNDMQVFDVCLDCTEPGAITLSRGGDYTLTVAHSTNPSTGTYRLQLFDVPIKPEIPIWIGDRIKPGVPIAGAGVIESPGSEDVFVFTAKPGEMVSFVLWAHSSGTDYLKWRLTDANETEIFSACFGCSQPGRKTLMLGGKYTLTVGHPGNPSTGTYDFEIGR